MPPVVGGRQRPCRDFHAGRPPRNRGHRYAADPPTVEEIVAVMRAAGDGRYGCRLRGLIVLLWRAGLRIHEALALNGSDLDRRRGSLLVRRGKGGRRGEVGMDEWAWEQLQPWLAARLELPVGPLFCLITGPTKAAPGCTRRPTADSCGRRRSAALRAPSAPPRACRRDGARRRAADRHPTPTRPQQPRHHLDLPPRHRQRRDHRRRPRPPRTDRAGQRLTPALRTPAGAARRALEHSAPALTGLRASPSQFDSERHRGGHRGLPHQRRRHCPFVRALRAHRAGSILRSLALAPGFRRARSGRRPGGTQPRRFTARATMTPVVTSAATPCTPIRALTRAVSGMVSVGLNAVWLVSET